MSSHSPVRSLSGLIDFEAAARWNSFRLAARELSKTPAAVSQQVRLLEETLGFALFIRHARGLSLTENGRALAHTATAVLQQWRARIQHLQSQNNDHLLRLSATHSFAFKWLMPRLNRFTAEQDWLDLQVDSSDALANVEDGSCDIALRYRKLRQNETALLFREQLLVIYSPRLCPAPLPLQALSGYPLLYEETPANWVTLLERENIRRPHVDFAHCYNHSGLLVQAAVAGHGVALAPYSLAYEDLRQGWLLTARCAPLPSEYGYCAHYAHWRAAERKITLFLSWMRQEVDQMLAWHQGSA
ncbi:LysR substrate-binding domain-containing protein [Paludibacterium sp. B53371]|uniref:LysR substrate-binding domain-containing protein n=1 Tax=Paludibacterium sp. B53371 TaxID=2806263 RepID=UPI001C05127A|nr:LysR substrate-binding domain-containing protein [Paludibacterium sp. B53371]